MKLSVLALVSAACAGIAVAADVQVVEQIVAKVNGDIITKGELDKSRDALEKQLREEKTPPQKIQQILKEREADALREQIDNLLLVQKGKELNINVDPDVRRELADIQTQNKIADQDKFRACVQEQSGMTDEDLKQQIKNRDLTQREMRREV